MEKQLLTEELDESIISINGRGDNPLIAVVGERKEGDEDLVSFVDLGDMDQSRTQGVDEAYRYLNGQPGQYRVMTAKQFSPKTVVIWSIFLFCAGVAATIFATQV